MENPGQAFIDYALPAWAAGDQAITTTALGEEGASELVVWEGQGQESATLVGGSGSFAADNGWMVTTLALGEEAGDAGLFSDPPIAGESLPAERGFGMAIEIDPLTGSEVIVCRDWPGTDLMDSPSQPNEGFVAEEPYGLVTTMALGEESGSPYLYPADPILDCTGGLFPGGLFPVPPPTGKPSDLPDGTKEALVQIDGELDPFYGANISSSADETVATTEPTILPNIAITQVTAASVATAGDQFDISWTYSISGDTSLSSHASLCVVTHSRNEVFGDDDDEYVATLYGGYDWSNPSPIGPVTSIQSILIPATFVGVGNLFFRQDGYNYLEESDEDDNIFMQAIKVQLPNLSIASAVAPAQVVSGEQVEMTWTVTNHGELALKGAYYQNVVSFSSNDVYGDDDDVQIFIDYSPFYLSEAIQPHESKTYSQNVSIPGTIAGDGYLFFAVDGFNHLSEKDESDNVVLQPFSVLQPDIAIDEVVVPAIATSGDQIQLAWSIVNRSGMTIHSANNFDSVIFSFNEIYGDKDDIFLENSLAFQPIKLAAFGTETITHSVYLPSNVAGDGYLLIKVDSGDLINETDESNNLFAQKISLFEKNISITSLSADSTVISGSALSLTIGIRNDGEYLINTFNPTQIVFSTNDLLGDNDDYDLTYGVYAKPCPLIEKPYSIALDYPNLSRCGTVGAPYQAVSCPTTLFNLQPGESQTISLPIYMPYYLSGNGYVFVVTSSGSSSSVPIVIIPQPGKVYSFEDSGFQWLRSTEIRTTSSAGTIASLPATQAPLINTIELAPEFVLMGDQDISAVLQAAMPLDLFIKPDLSHDNQSALPPFLPPTQSSGASSSELVSLVASPLESDQPIASFTALNPTELLSIHATETFTPTTGHSVTTEIVRQHPSTESSKYPPKEGSSTSPVSRDNSSPPMHKPGAYPTVAIHTSLDRTILNNFITSLTLLDRRGLPSWPSSLSKPLSTFDLVGIRFPIGAMGVYQAVRNPQSFYGLGAGGWIQSYRTWITPAKGYQYDGLGGLGNLLIDRLGGRSRWWPWTTLSNSPMEQSAAQQI